MVIKGEIGMDKNLFEVRDELAGELKEIQLSGKETSKGWEVLEYLREVDYTIRLITNTIYIGVRR